METIVKIYEFYGIFLYLSITQWIMSVEIAFRTK